MITKFGNEFRWKDLGLPEGRLKSSSIRVKWKLSVVAALAVLVDVKSLFLHALVNTESNGVLDRPEEYNTAGGCPSVYTKDAEGLCTEESEAMTIESSLTGGEQTGQQSTENTIDPVNGTGTDRVVDMKFLVDELNGKRQCDTAAATDDDRTHH